MPLGNYNITQPNGDRILLPQGGELDKPNDPLFEQPVNQVNLDLSPGQVHGEIAPGMGQVTLSLAPAQTTALVGIFVSLGQVNLSLSPQSYGIELRTSLGQVSLSLTPGQATINPVYVGPPETFTVERAVDFLSTDLTWTAVDQALSYKIYRATRPDAAYSLLTTETDLEHTDSHSDAESDWTYRISVVSWTDDEGPRSFPRPTSGDESIQTE